MAGEVPVSESPHTTSKSKRLGLLIQIMESSHEKATGRARTLAIVTCSTYPESANYSSRQSNDSGLFACREVASATQKKIRCSQRDSRIRE